MTKIVSFLFLLILLNSCISENRPSDKSLICGNNSKTWEISKTIVNGIHETKQTHEGKDRFVTFYSNGTVDIEGNNKNTWKINTGVINFNLTTGITTKSYNCEIIKLDKDSFIYRTIDNNEIIMEYLLI